MIPLYSQNVRNQLPKHHIPEGQAPQHTLAIYRGADKPLARPGRKKATATEDFDVHISYL